MLNVWMHWRADEELALDPVVLQGRNNFGIPFHSVSLLQHTSSIGSVIGHQMGYNLLC